MEKNVMQAAPEIKVKTKRFLLRKGKIKIRFALDKSRGMITALYLKQRGAVEPQYFPFMLTKREKGEEIRYDAALDVNTEKMAVGFWDVVVKEETPEGGHEAILGGLSAKLKLMLILFPRWTRTRDEHVIYPFVNGARQFTIQYRKYDKRYDSYRFLFKELLALLVYGIGKPFWDRKRLWLICEKFSAMAQDNGLYFFRYCMEKLPQEEKKHIFYVIDKTASDYEAVRQYDENVISFMSFRYMIYLCAAQYLISTDAIRHFYIWDSPNSIYKVLYQARKHIIFLQHGVMGFKQCHRTFHKSGGNRMALFVVSSEYEQDIIHNYFEYDRDEIIITGLPRWDVLHDTSSPAHKEILLMPTWRSWLEYVSDEVFLESEYYRNYKSFLTNPKLFLLLDKYDVTLNFYIHPKFRDYIGLFEEEDLSKTGGGQRIRLIPFGSEPLNKLLMSCSMLVTDYSSVAWDVYYQEKPVVFYPFDLNTYESQQGSYMDLRKEAFGPLVYHEEELLLELEKYMKNDFLEEECYKERRAYLLPLRDDKNSERIYKKIKDARLEKKFHIRGRL